MSISVLGINYRTAPIAIRERVSYSAAEVPGVLQRLKEKLPEAEFVLLSTCNRTELYTANTDVAERTDTLLQTLVGGGTGVGQAEVSEHLYVKTRYAAAEHLLAVAASLDSMVVGETEVLGQAKQAYVLAGQAETCGKTLNTLFQGAFRVAKQVHTETGIAHGRVSVSSIAVEFAEKIFDELAAKNIMIVGSGETAELTLKSLVERPVREVMILNRSLERAERLAEAYDGRAIQFDSLAEYLPRADIVISSTSCPHCVIHADMVREASQARHGRPMLLIDIAVPRDIEPSAGELKDVYVYDIDDLQKVADENHRRRREAVDSAWVIVRQAAGAMAESIEIPDVGELMRAIDARTRDICDAELKRALAKQDLASLPDASREQIERLAERIASKLVAPSKASLREASRNGTWETFSRAAREILGLAGVQDSREEE